MKKKFLTPIFLLSAMVMSCQNLSYGIILGAVIYNYQSSNSDGEDEVYFDSGSADFIVPNLGGYVEYGFTKNMGVKLEVSYNKKTFDKGINHHSLDERYQFGYVDVNPNFKLDFGQEYRKGFYVMAGPKIGFLSNAEFEGEDVSEQFKSTYLGASLGLGQRILKFLEIETKFDLGLTPFYKDEASNCKIFNLYVSLNVDVERIINGH